MRNTILCMVMFFMSPDGFHGPKVDMIDNYHVFHGPRMDPEAKATLIVSWIGCKVTLVEENHGFHGVKVANMVILVDIYMVLMVSKRPTEPWSRKAMFIMVSKRPTWSF